MRRPSCTRCALIAASSQGSTMTAASATRSSTDARSSGGWPLGEQPMSAEARALRVRDDDEEAVARAALRNQSDRASQPVGDPAADPQAQTCADAHLVPVVIEAAHDPLGLVGRYRPSRA